MSFFAKLPDWSLIHASGADAQTFLHGQLTNDLLHLAPDAAQWSGYCTAKGRMLAGFLVWRDGGDGFYLATDRALLSGLVKRLKMFVLRAKVVIEDCSAQWAALGLCEDLPAVAPAMLDGDGDADASSASSAGPRQLIGVRRVQKGGVRGGVQTEVQSDGRAEVRSGERADGAGAGGAESPASWRLDLPAVEGRSRCLMWVNPADVEPVLAASTLPPAGALAWTRLMVLAGEAWITQPTQEAFVPQMINFDALDGINFKKGCYPGQEIVARAHYRGAVKRRMYRATVDAPAKAGDVLYASDLNGQESGLIALAAPAADQPGLDARSGSDGLTMSGGHTAQVSEVLAVIQIQSHASAEIRLGAPDGPLLRFAPLPYAFPEAV